MFDKKQYQYLKALSLGNSQSADKAPTLTYHLMNKLSIVSDCAALIQKCGKFKKIDGKPATYGA